MKSITHKPKTETQATARLKAQQKFSQEPLEVSTGPWPRLRHHGDRPGQRPNNAKIRKCTLQEPKRTSQSPNLAPKASSESQNIKPEIYNK